MSLQFFVKGHEAPFLSILLQSNNIVILLISKRKSLITSIFSFSASILGFFEHVLFTLIALRRSLLWLGLLSIVFSHFNCHVVLIWLFKICRHIVPWALPLNTRTGGSDFIALRVLLRCCLYRTSSFKVENRRVAKLAKSY